MAGAVHWVMVIAPLFCTCARLFPLLFALGEFPLDPMVPKLLTNAGSLSHSRLLKEYLLIWPESNNALDDVSTFYADGYDIYPNKYSNSSVLI